MNLRYLGSSEKEVGSFWAYYPRVRYDFEITTMDKEDNLMNLFEKEFKLNCRNQLKDNFVV